MHTPNILCSKYNKNMAQRFLHLNIPYDFNTSKHIVQLFLCYKTFKIKILEGPIHFDKNIRNTRWLELRSLKEQEANMP